MSISSYMAERTGRSPIAGLLEAALFVLVVLAGFAAHAQESDTPPFRIVTVAEGLKSPWGLAFLPDGSFLVTEKAGQLVLLSPGGKKETTISLPLPVVSRQQGGLLDVALHPDFANNKLVYFSYVARGYGGTGTEVARARLANGRLHDLQVIFKARPKARSDVHFGSRLLFSPGGYLYVTLGERFQMDRAQELSSHHGTIVRLHDDGRAPEDNPFADKENALPEIFTYGHRNVQGIALQPGTDRIWIHEHGPRGGDEVNILKPGANYGWPVITYGIDYDGSTISEKTHQDGMEQPVIHWTPSIAPSGMAFYEGDKFPQWRGDLFAGALAGNHLRHMDVEGEKIVSQQSFLTDFGARIRDVRAGPDGYIYLLTDSTDGKLVRLEPPEAAN